MRKLNLGMICVMLAIFVGMVGVAATYPADARFMPFVVGIPAIALCIVQLVLDLRRKPVMEAGGESNELMEAEARIKQMTGRDVSFDVARDTSIPQEEFLPEEEAAKREKILWAAFLGLIAGIILIGFHVMMPLFIILFLRYLASYTWTRSIIAGLIGAGIIIGIFEYVLRNELFRGLLTNWVMFSLGY